MKKSRQGKYFHTSPFYQKNNASEIRLPGKRLSGASRMKSLFSHRLNSISLTWRLVFDFRSAVSKTYFPDVPLLFRRRSEVHLWRGGCSCAPTSLPSWARELCTRKPTDDADAGRSRCTQTTLLPWKRCKTSEAPKESEARKHQCTLGHVNMAVCHRG